MQHIHIVDFHVDIGRKKPNQTNKQNKKPVLDKSGNFN